MPRQHLSEKEIKYVELRAEGKSQIEAALGAGYTRSTSVKSAFLIDRRSLVYKTLEQRKATVQAFLELHGCGLPLLNDSLKKSLREGNPASQRLFLEVFDILGPEKMRELASKWEEQLAQAISHAATIFVAFIPADRRPDFEKCVSELRAQKLGSGQREEARN
jgi:hypothetical protein